MKTVPQFDVFDLGRLVICSADGDLNVIIHMHYWWFMHVSIIIMRYLETPSTVGDWLEKAFQLCRSSGSCWQWPQYILRCNVVMSVRATSLPPAYVITYAIHRLVHSAWDNYKLYTLRDQMIMNVTHASHIPVAICPYIHRCRQSRYREYFIPSRVEH